MISRYFHARLIVKTVRRRKVLLKVDTGERKGKEKKYICKIQVSFVALLRFLTHSPTRTLKKTKSEKAKANGGGRGGVIRKAISVRKRYRSVVTKTR